VGYPDSLLGEDEDVVLHLRTHWKALVRPALVLVATTGAASFLAAAVPAGSAQGWARLAVLAAAAVVVLRWAVWPYLAWWTSTFTLTDRRVVVRSGVLSRQGRDMPLARVNDVHFAHTFVERLLGCGTVVVESAGERGQLVLDDVPRVEHVQRELYRLVEEDEARRRRGDDADDEVVADARDADDDGADVRGIRDGTRP
jgi:uncharacterized membrane protein YdbT with pleckstrin-like domain